MKTRKNFKLLKLSVLIPVILFAVFACEKNEDNSNPEYIGTWISSEILTEDSLTLEFKDEISFSKNSFEEIGRIKDPQTNKWIDLISFKANFSVNNSKMEVSIKEIGISAFDWETGMPTGIMVYYKEGQSVFERYLKNVEMNKTFRAEYQISENSLTLKSDINSDGVFDDEDEVVVYSHQ